MMGAHLLIQTAIKNKLRFKTEPQEIEKNERNIKNEDNWDILRHDTTESCQRSAVPSCYRTQQHIPETAMCKYSFTANNLI